MVDGGGERLPHDRHERSNRPDVFGQVLMLDNRRLLEQDAYTHLVARVAQVGCTVPHCIVHATDVAVPRRIQLGCHVGA